MTQSELGSVVRRAIQLEIQAEHLLRTTFETCTLGKRTVATSFATTTLCPMRNSGLENSRSTQWNTFDAMVTIIGNCQSGVKHRTTSLLLEAPTKYYFF